MLTLALLAAFATLPVTPAQTTPERGGTMIPVLPAARVLDDTLPGGAGMLGDTARAATPASTSTTSASDTSGRLLARADAADTTRPRVRAIEYSDWYERRLTIHRIGSYTMLPLFGAEYALGQNLLNDSRPASWLKPSHVAVASAIGVLFAVNTMTGVWNLWDARQDPAGRTRRTIHAALLLASDAGFVWAAQSGGARQQSAYGVAGPSIAQERRHRNIALGSMALSTIGTAMMWFWRQ